MHAAGRISIALVVGVASAVLSTGAAAQQPGQLTVGPAVGDAAPEFEMQGITRYGVLKEKTKLSDFRGQAVVLAFFPKARSRG
jgi:hypothetical protein